MSEESKQNWAWGTKLKELFNTTKLGSLDKLVNFCTAL